MTDLKALAAEFPRGAVSWRSQSLTKDGKKALALAYIDARDVMDRLDTVCGPENWQDRYEFHGSRTVCYLSIRIGTEWITKADGAGDSDVEAEKGAISDALKRAAVKWGIGRYLYAIESPWVPCESYDKGGKFYWSKWTADPWSCIRGGAPRQEAPALPAPSEYQRHFSAIALAADLTALQSAFGGAKADKSLTKEEADNLIAAKDQRKRELQPIPATLGDHLDNLKAIEDARNPVPN